MRFEILSHACMLVSTDEASVIIDPWLIGSAYWRSWWNYPKAVYDIEKLQKVDAVIISHIHWDHWHGATLKKFFLGKKFIIPDEPGIRSEQDLRSIGISDIKRVRHGETFRVNDLNIRLYQFGLYLNDSAVVVSNDKVKIMNANDAKISGSALKSLLSKEGKIDFALRSHSTANSRACYKLRGSKEVFDDNEHYLRSFKIFMDAVQPKFAVPFASNHCHLHPETYHFNKIISNPFILEEYLDGHSKAWSFEVMLPGSSWEESEGFSHLHSKDNFSDLPIKLQEYQNDVLGALEKQNVREERVSINDQMFSRFIDMLPNSKSVPKKYHRGFSIRLNFPESASEVYCLKIMRGKYQIIKMESDLNVSGPEISMPALIFRDAIVKNMFHHAAISKRCEFIGDEKHDLILLSFFFGALERTELVGRNGLDIKYLLRSARVYTNRVPEILVYFKAFILLKFFRYTIYDVEELILEGKWLNEKRNRAIFQER